MLIAFDGPSASGKGSLAQNIAKHYNLPYLDTGLLYRYLAFKIHESNININDLNKIAPLIENLSESELQNPILRSNLVSELASQIATHPEIRSLLFNYQRKMALNPSGAVIDGRDIGTVICPEADLKFFVIAKPEIRADRRFHQLLSMGLPADYSTILAEIKQRDERDMNRATSPLRPADDAIIIDTSDLDIAACLELIKSHIEDKVKLKQSN